MELEWSYLFSSAIILLPAFILLFSLKKATNCSYKLPPGPRGLPIFGNIFELGTVPYKKLAGLKQKYGPILWLKLGTSTNIMVVQTAQAAAELFKNHDISFAGRFIPDVNQAHSYYQGSMAIGRYGSFWRFQRRISTVEMFVHKKISETVPVRRKCVDNMVKWIEKEANSVEKGSGIEVTRFVFLASFNMLGNLILSKDLADPKSEEASEFFNAMKRINEWSGIANVSDMFPFLRKFDLQSLRKKMARDMGKAMKIASMFLKEREEERKKGAEKGKDFLDVLLEFEGTGKDEPANLSEHEIKVFVLEMFLAGSETTSSSVEWALTELLRHPQAMDKSVCCNVDLGEGMSAIPVIKCCVERRPDVTVLMTTTTTSAFEVLQHQLPKNVIYQFSPVDTPGAIDAFLRYWKPSAIILMESELWPNLIIGAAKNKIALALLNARISANSYDGWSQPFIIPLTSLMLSKFLLILPLSTTQAIRFQLLQCPPFIINFCGDLKYAVGNIDTSEGDQRALKELHVQLTNRKVWMASSIHKGEEKVMLGVHNALNQIHPDIITIIVPRHPQHGEQIALELEKDGVRVALRSRHDKLMPGTNIYVVDTLGELQKFYRLTPIAVIGGSFLPGSAGHNISEAAAAGCAILTGPYIGHFSQMATQMQRLNPLSVLQVSGHILVEALNNLLSDAKILEARQEAAKQAYHALSFGITENVWSLLDFHIIRIALAHRDCP
ncbi:hypothetical protein K7X08_037623 [Anisodus acutangulus]|uniref:lipid IVA 3-deoxy-D-manno-octulosonic acid transferase n=1 Tax=Anisodus acutangulus TaxID=402998 RepID=A0A9Q1MX00_9SOLA|nr:hypothetical protein K7X08_037623 [Anisodus acutangulus]